MTKPVGEKKIESTTRQLLTNETATITQTPTRTNQLPNRWSHGRNGPVAQHHR